MTDIFREVEEDLRQERFEKLWKKYGDYLIAGAALLVIAAAGFQLWRIYDQRQRAAASTSYVLAEQMLESGQANEAAAMFAKLAQNGPSGYAQLALLEEADALYAAGNTPEAVDLYKQVAAKGNALLAPVARIRAAWAIVETAPRSDVAALLAPLVDPLSPWHPMAREILAYADYRAGAIKQALGEFQGIAKDHDTPSAMRQRADAMAIFLAAGGDKDFGSVPPPAPNETGGPQAAPSAQNPSGSAGGSRRP
ncbi:MAG: tetratricopeptide repeat protein [Rhizomicrobium sp.]